VDRNWYYKNIILTASGQSAGIYLYDIFDNRQRKMLSLSAYESVYALDVHRQTQTLAVGSKACFIYLIRPDENLQDSESFSVTKFAQNAPVLSVRFIGQNRLAAADTTGRCVIWQLSENPQAKILSTDNLPICELLCPGRDKLAGLSVDGNLTIWNLAEENKEITLSCKHLAKPAGLTKAVFWPAKNTWLWPAEEGLLAGYDFDQNKLTVTQAHQASFYTAINYQDKLLTIGLDDRAIKLWQPDSDIPEKVFQCPKALISAAVFEDDGLCMLAADKKGTAGIYRFEKDRLEHIRNIEGYDFRVISGPDLEDVKSCLAKEKTLKAEAISQQIKEKISSIRQDGLNSLHQQLTDLGFRHVSLLLQARSAYVCDDFIGQLKAYKKLTELLRSKNKIITDVMIAYAELLEKAWLVRQALDIYQIITNTKDGSDFSSQIEKLCEYETLMKNSQSFIEPGMEISELIESRKLMDELFTGKFVIKTSEPVVIDSNITTEEFIERYEHIRSSEDNDLLSVAGKEICCFLSQNNITKTEVISFEDHNSRQFCQPHMALRIERSPQQTVFIPFIYIKSELGENISKDQHNSTVSDELNKFQKKSFSSGSIRAVNKTILFVIRRLLSRQLAKGNYPAGVKS